MSAGVFVLADAYPMIIAAAVVGVVACLFVIAVGLWMVADR